MKVCAFLLYLNVKCRQVVPPGLFVLLVCCLLLCTRVISAQPLALPYKADENPLVNNLDKKVARMEAILRQVETINIQYPDSALVLCYSVYNQSKRIGFPDGMASALLWMGSIYLVSKGEPVEALVYYRQAYTYCMQAVNVKDGLLVLWHNDMAAAFSAQGVYDSAMVYYYSALNTALRYNWKDPKDLSMMYNNIASIHYVLQQYDEAIPYLEKAKQLGIKGNLKTALTETYNTLACIFMVKDKLDSARWCLEKVNSLNVNISPHVQGQLYYLKGMIVQKEGSPQKAISYFKESMVLNGNNARDKINNLIGLGTAYLLLKDYNTSVHYFLDAQQESYKVGIGGRSLAEIYENIAEVYDSSRSYREAYQYKSLAASLKDSINKMENARSLHKLEDRFQTTEKDKELTAKKLQLVLAEAGLRKKNLWIGGILSGAFILLSVAALISQKQRLQLQRVKTARQQQQVQQLKAVIEGEEKERSRIGRQLHDDIMVQLSIVKMSMEALPMEYPGIKEAQGYKNIVQQVQNTSRQLRQTAHNLMPDALLEEGLASAVLYFCRNVENLTTIRMLFQQYGDLPPLSSDTEISIYRIIQELVQNIIKHAEANNALVQLNYLEGILSITVEDDGIGMQLDEGMLENRMGLKSIRTRLKAMDGSIEIHPCTPHGTSVNIELNI